MKAIIARTASAKFRVLALSLAALANSGCFKEQPTKAQYLARANDYFAAGQYEKAKAEYLDALRAAPADPRHLL